VNATIVPFQLTGQWPSGRFAERLRNQEPGRPPGRRETGAEVGVVEGTTPIAEADWRARVRVAGRVRQVRIPTRNDNPNLEVTLVDSSGAILLVFQGRRQIAGIQQGARLVAQGTVGAWKGHQAILNPHYELLAPPDAEPAEPGH
jgi:hypothetical protein